jgi:hypothetical protein
MSRFVVPKRPGLAAGTTEPPDGFKGRLTKYLPTEIISLYTVAIGGLVSAKPDVSIAPWIAVGLMALFCAGALTFVGLKAPAGVVRKAHLVASPIAFLAWGYPLAAPLLGSWFIGWIAIIGQAIAALAAWLLEPEEKPVAS